MPNAIGAIIYTSFSAVSAAFSFSVVLTGLFWPGMMLSKCRPFSNILFFISLSDFLGSVANSFGFPPNGSKLCSAQSFFYLYFLPASWLWTLLLVYQLRTLILFKSLNLSLKWMHIICWTIPLIPTLLPLSTNEYGQDDGLNEASPCVLGGNEKMKFLWIIASDTGLAFICFVLMAIWSAEIFKFCFLTEHTESFEKEISLFQSMRLYPLVLFITWVPSFVEGVLAFASLLSTSYYTVITPVLVLETQYGTIVTIIYFSQSKAARMLWMDLFRKTLSRFNMIDTTIEADFDSSRLISNVEETDEDILVQRLMSRDSMVSIYANEISGIGMSEVSTF